ncbi:MAG: hypothetical protein M1829_003324 [Trizodia sp. TS-e1964]|nr:MAG: hypothetical protein M1829_003324 [Trizodia sp. TS-e1964]
MLLSLGMTADVAAAHKHEFSAPRLPRRRSAQPSRYPISGMTTPSSPVLPRPVSVRIPSTHTALPAAPRVLEEESEALSRSNSRSNSRGSAAGATVRGKKARARSKTSFQLAHPPPSMAPKQRLHIRPKLLLQLQLLSISSRPTPALDVLPSAIFAPRLARRFPRVFKGKDSLGPNDLVIVTSDEYSLAIPDLDTVSEDSNDDSGARQVLATICQLRRDESLPRGKVEICLNQGPSWEARPLQNGSYEFTASGETGSKLTARWVRRNSPTRRRSSALYTAPTSPSSSPEEDREFNFSIIDPDTRRHPIIASMNRSTINILDQYQAISSVPTATSPITSPVSPLPTPSSSTTFSSTTLEGIDAAERLLVETDESLKTLILITGIWVAFRENWSQNFRYNDTLSSGSSMSSNNSSPSKGTTNRPLSTSFAKSKQGENADSHPTSSGVGGKILRSGSHLLHRSRLSSGTNDSQSSVPQRANSTGTAFIERANNRHSSASKKAGLLRAGMQQRAMSDQSTSSRWAEAALPDPSPRGSLLVESLHLTVPPNEYQHVPKSPWVEPQPRQVARNEKGEERGKWSKLRGFFHVIKRSNGAN